MLPIRDLRRISFVDGKLTILCHIGAFLNSVGGASSQINYKQRRCHCCCVTISYRIGYQTETLGGFLLSIATWPSSAILEPFSTLWEGRVHKTIISKDDTIIVSLPLSLLSIMKARIVNCLLQELCSVLLRQPSQLSGSHLRWWLYCLPAVKAVTAISAVWFPPEGMALLFNSCESCYSHLSCLVPTWGDGSIV
jgi:hypothetical protein